MSAATSARNVGAALAPVVGPAHTVFFACVFRLNVKAGVVVAEVTEAVAIPVMLAALKLVTLPCPYPCVCTYAVVAIAVLLSTVAGVGAVGVGPVEPRRAGVSQPDRRTAAGRARSPIARSRRRVDSRAAPPDRRAVFQVATHCR